MNQALNLFFKDARRLWLQVLVFLSLLAVYLSSDPAYTGLDRLSSRWIVLSLLTPLACWIVVASMIHQETLVGDRQYWLTRPFTWAHLLAAKALFVVAFIMLPLFSGHILVLHHLGLPVAQSLPALLMRETLFLAAYVLPVAALAAVTRNLAEMVLAAMVGYVLFLSAGMTLHAFNLPCSWGEFEWIRISLSFALLTLGTTSVLLIQFVRRRTGVTRALAAATLVSVFVSILLPPGSWVFPIQALFSRRQIDNSAGQIVLDAIPARHGKDLVWGGELPKGTVLTFLVRIEGLPPGLAVGVAAAQFAVRSADAGEWRSAWRLFHVLQAPIPNLWIALPIDASFYERVKDDRVSIAGFVDLTLDTRDRAQVTPAIDCLDYVPGAGVCGFRAVRGQEPEFGCLTPWPRARVYFGDALGLVQTPDESETWPTGASLSPVERHSVYSHIPIEWSTEAWVTHPVAHIRRYFEFHDVRPRDHFAANY